MTERKVSVRIAAAGGDKLKADLVAIGREGKAALQLIEGGGAPAARGLTTTGEAASVLSARLDAVAARAAAAASSMRRLEGAGAVVARIDSATGVSSGVARDRADIDAYGQALDAARAKHNPLFAEIQRYKAQLADIRRAHAVGAISSDEMTAAIGRSRKESLASIAAIKGRSSALTELGGSSRLAAYQQRVLLSQINDIGVSLAGGMSPFTVLLQQGSQIVEMYSGQGGVRAALGQVGNLVSGLGRGIALVGRALLGVAGAHPLITAAVAATGAAFLGLQQEINATSDVQVSMGDTVLAVCQTIRDGAWSLLAPVWAQVADWAGAAFAQIGDWAGIAWDAVVTGVHIAGNAIINGFAAAIETVKAYWSALPSALGAAAIGAANAVLAAVDFMLNRMTPRINRWIAGINAVIASLPDWARPDWAQIPAIPAVSIGRLDNPYAADLKDRWSDYTARIGEIAGRDPLGDLFGAVRERAQANARAREAAAAAAAADGGARGGAAGGGRGRGGGAGAKPAETRAELEAIREEELSGIAAISEALNRAYEDARNIGQGIGESLVGAFQSAEEAVSDFVRTGKLDVSDLASSVIADFARMTARSFLFAPLSNALSGALGGFGGLGGAVSAFVQHEGGMAGTGPRRAVAAAAFLQAPRLHAGMPMGLRADEYAAILQRGERVLNRRQTQEYERGAFGGPTVVTIQTRDAASFRQSRTQIAADLARAVARGRRGI